MKKQIQSKKPQLNEKPPVRSFASHDELMADMRNFKKEVTASPSAARRTGHSQWQA